MDKFDQYKRLLRLGIAGIEIILEAAFFTYVWFGVYNGRRLYHIDKNIYRRRTANDSRNYL